MTAKPATPLPWDWMSDDRGTAGVMKLQPSGEIDPLAERAHKDDAAYIVEACNAYPRLMAEREELVAALRKVVKEFRPLGLRMAQPGAGFMKTGNAIVAMCDSFSELLARIEGAE